MKKIPCLLASLALLPLWAGATPVLANYAAFGGNGFIETWGSQVSGGDVGSDKTVTVNSSTIYTQGGALAPVNGTPSTPLAFSAIVLPAASVFSSGSLNESAGGGQSLSLAPGSYGNLALGGDNTLNLSAGTYYFNNWNVSGGSFINLNLSGGAIQIYFTGNVDLSGNVQTSVIGGTAAEVYAEVLGDWEQSGSSSWDGTVFASGASSDITLSGEATLTGSAWARDELTLQSSNIDYVASSHTMAQSLTGSVSVPEPATLPLVLLGSAAALLGRRRRSSAAQPPDRQ